MYGLLIQEFIQRIETSDSIYHQNMAGITFEFQDFSNINKICFSSHWREKIAISRQFVDVLIFFLSH